MSSILTSWTASNTEATSCQDRTRTAWRCSSSSPLSQNSHFCDFNKQKKTFFQIFVKNIEITVARELFIFIGQKVNYYKL
jgi:hypothetical protein